MILVLFVIPAPSEGPTGPVDIAATIVFNSQFRPGFDRFAHPFHDVSPSVVQKLSFEGRIPTAMNSSDECPMNVLSGVA